MKPREVGDSLARLEPGTVLTLPRGAGRGIAVFAGLVWVTERGVRGDHFLGAGDSLELESRGPVVVQAFGTAQLIVFATAVTAA